MRYIVKKVGTRYEILDSSSNTKQLLGVSDIKNIVDNGTYIRGVAYIDNELVVTPVVPLFNATKEKLAFNKLVTGSTAGVSGFNLKLSGDNIIALPLEDDFYDYINKNKTGDKFVFVLPDGITELSENFMEQGFCDCENLKVYIDLPESLKVIESNAFQSNYASNLYITGIRFNGIVDRIYGSSDEDFSDYDYCTCFLSGQTYVKSHEFRIKNIEMGSIEFSTQGGYTEDGIEIHLPDTELLEESSIRVGSSNLDVFLGKNIEEIRSFRNPTIKPDSSPEVIMSSASVVHVPDNCNLEVIDLDNEYFYYNSSYVAVLSDKEYDRLKSRFSNGDLDIINDDPVCFVGVLTYSSQKELQYIKDNIHMFLCNHEEYFSNCMCDDDLGEIIRLKLKTGLID